MTRTEHACAARKTGAIPVPATGADIVHFPITGQNSGAASMALPFWGEIDAAGRRERAQRRTRYWLAAVAAHLAFAALFLIELTQPSDIPRDDATVEMVAPPAPPHPEPTPPKPAEVKEASKPKPVVRQAIPKPAVKLTLPPIAAPPIPAIAVPPPQPEPPPPAPEARSAPPPDYVSALYAHIAAYKRYPRAALQAHIQGTVLLRFTMDRQGRVLSARVERGSGHDDLDAEALSTIQRAQPLPAPPPELAAPVEITIPVQFAVR